MIRRALRVFVVLAVCAASAQAQRMSIVIDEGGQTFVGRPDFRPERAALEVVGGTYAGLAGYFVGRSLGTVATMMMSVDHDRTRDDIVHATGIVGGAFAIGGTVFAIGDMGKESGSFPVTMLGVGVGAGAGFLLSRAVFHGRTPANRTTARRKWLAATIESALPALGATIAFNSTRKWQP